MCMKSTVKQDTIDDTGTVHSKFCKNWNLKAIIIVIYRIIYKTLGKKHGNSMVNMYLRSDNS